MLSPKVEEKNSMVENLNWNSKKIRFIRIKYVNRLRLLSLLTFNRSNRSAVLTLYMLYRGYEYRSQMQCIVFVLSCTCILTTTMKRIERETSNSEKSETKRRGLEEIKCI